jgi:quercetin dioxygenase-like cupin family protein
MTSISGNNFSVLALTIGMGLCATAVNANADELARQTVTRAGTQTPVEGDGTRFDGNVRVDPLTPGSATINASSAYVTFAPGARSAWHTHPAGQFLVVTAGTGLTQEWGQPVQRLHVGDVVWCPPDVKHWHGATPTHAMTHLAITSSVPGRSVTWMEKVSDAQYPPR